MVAEFSGIIERATVAQSPSGGDEHGLNEDHGRGVGHYQGVETSRHGHWRQGGCFR
jgi:hypothetical protein